MENLEEIYNLLSLVIVKSGDSARCEVNNYLQFKLVSRDMVDVTLL